VITNPKNDKLIIKFLSSAICFLKYTSREIQGGLQVWDILCSRNGDLKDEILTNFIKQSTWQRGKEQQQKNKRPK
jgi:hypothetical protein